MPLTNFLPSKIPPRYEATQGQIDIALQYDAVLKLLHKAGFKNATFQKYYLMEPKDHVGYISLEVI